VGRYIFFALFFLSIISGPLENCVSRKIAENQKQSILEFPKRTYYLNKIFENTRVVLITWTNECVPNAIRFSYHNVEDIFFNGDSIFITTWDENGLKVPMKCVEKIETAEIKNS